ncbi:MAG: TolC family protein [Bacteroidia bacterium]|jgi:outer membrane protein TolC|nr:TolC family protein [Bacteroidia bacterium]
MKNSLINMKSLLLLCSLIFINSVKSQEKEQKTAFSLQEAIDFALGHNQNYINSTLDVESAKFRNKEYTGIGLPQINASADVKDYLTIPTSVIPAQAFNPSAPADQFVAVQFGVKYNAAFGVSISQILFNTDYLVGLQAAKEFVALSEKNVQRTKVETYATITKAYYGAIIVKERLKIIDANIDRVKKLFDDTKALNSAGFAEKLDVDRVELTYNNLLAEKEKLERYVGISETLLKYQMGYDLALPITLTDVIDANLIIDMGTQEQQKVNYEARPEFSILQSQSNINGLELKRNKYQYLPSLAAYASLQQQAMRTKFDVFDIDQPWYPIRMIGVTLNVPIFNGGQKHYKIQQSKLELQKTNNSLEFLQRSIDVEVANTNMQFKNALIALETQRKNKDLAKDIYDTSKIKYETGVGSNLDVIYAQAAFREAEINFLSAVYDLIVAQVDYQKAKGILVK